MPPARDGETDPAEDQPSGSRQAGAVGTPGAGPVPPEGDPTPAEGTPPPGKPAKKAAPQAAKKAAKKAVPKSVRQAPQKVTGKTAKKAANPLAPNSTVSAPVEETEGARGVTAGKAARGSKAVASAVPESENPDEPGAIPRVAKPRRTSAARRSALEPPEAPVRVVPPVLGRLLDRPDYAPELLALAAVASVGPHAADWARRTRERYPAATPYGLARLAIRRHVRLAAAGGVASAAAGLFAPLAGVAALSWTRAALVLHLAAVHGRDPLDPERAVDLLLLNDVHPDAESARAALASAEAAPDRPQPAPSGHGPPVPALVDAGARLAAPLAVQTGGWLALRLAARALPGAAVLAAAAASTGGMERLAARAVARYRSPGVAYDTGG